MDEWTTGAIVRALMLAAVAADAVLVVSRGIWIVSMIACLFVVASFALFATDQFGGASERTQQVVLDQSPTAPQAKKPGEPRRTIDEVASKLRSPFDGIVHAAKSEWVRETVPTLLALLVYGFGLGYLARYARARA
ncbi:MAG: hypothetical protein U0T02_07565 [Solirubrobacteraceae bacterium]